MENKNQSGVPGPGTPLFITAPPMKKLLFTLAALFCFTVAHAGDEPITLYTATGDIHGMLMLPKGNTPCPVVLIIAGSGPTDMNGNSIGARMTNNSLLFLANGLAENGIASVRYDKRGIGKSADAGGKEEELRFDHYINDAAAWADKLGSDSRFSKVIIAGHSEGSLIGMVAAQRSKAVIAYISIAGCGSPAYEIIEKQLQGNPEKIRNESAAICKELCQGRTVTDIPFYLMSLYRPSVQPYLISWFRYNPVNEIARLSIPVFIAQGDKDIQVGVDEAEKLHRALPNASCLVVKNMNHVLKHCDSDNMQLQLMTYNNPDLPVKQELIEAITDFIKR